ncbi:MAG: PilZ domain-containing protein [Methyloprofundus sp.]|nr:PilZ domain-containing protein [Methyloprofundus sp.]
MAASIIDKSTENRRRALRSYEHVDLFYQKISSPADYSTPSKHQDDEASFVQDKDGHLPKSSSQENETLNVNISATGISYTCLEELQPGEHILLRILLLSSMTVVTVSCEVVYCKPSNPFESDSYPFLIGAKFVNIRAEDTKILEQHIYKKKAKHYSLQALLAVFLISLISFPDTVFELIIGGIEFVVEFVIEALFIAYEVISMYLEHAVEAVLHTHVHDTQLISFYILWAVGIAIGFFTFKKVVLFCKNLLYCCKLFYFRKKASLNYYWQQKTLIYKTGIIAGTITILLTYLLFFV